MLGSFDIPHYCLRLFAVCLGLAPLSLACGNDSSAPAQRSPAPVGPLGGILEADAGSIPLNGGAGGSGGASGDAGRAGTGGAGVGGSGGSAGAATGQAFQPNVPYAYVGKGSNAGLSISAGSILSMSDNHSAEMLLAVKGVGPDPVCIVSVPADLLDAAGNQLTHVEILVRSPMYTTFGSAEPCIGSGDIGMGQTILSSMAFDLTQLARVEYGISGNIDPAAMKIPVTVDNVTISKFSSTSMSVTGVLKNHSSVTYKYPEVNLFTVDPAGRPLAMGSAIDSGQLPGDGSFSFMMYVQSPVDQYVTYPAFDSL